jgi:hypothetical protein
MTIIMLDTKSSNKSIIKGSKVNKKQKCNKNSNITQYNYLDTKQNFKPKIENKTNYGEVNTPYSLIEEMLDLFPDSAFKNPNTKWLDPACGYGYFMDVLVTRLMKSLKEVIPKQKQREKHIIENMIYMCEYNEENIDIVTKKYQKGKCNTNLKPNIYHIDFLSTTLETFQPMNQQFNKNKNNNNTNGFDYIIGNPPYNSGGLKKVPTNTQIKKTSDGKTIWIPFVKHSISLLKPCGYLSMIIPSIWMKPDKARMYDFMLSYTIHKIKTFTNTETKKIFKGQAQTPTCYFLLENKKIQHTSSTIKPPQRIDIYDKISQEFVPFSLYDEKPIPLCGGTIIQKLQDKVLEYFPEIRPFNIHKTNTPSSKNKIYPTQNIILDGSLNISPQYENIRSCILKNKIEPKLVIEYSTEQCSYHGIQKIVLGHKMYGFPYYDKEGQYGISARDNYVITDLSENYKIDEERFIDEWELTCQLLNTQFIRFLFESTRYRMKYLEKYIFEYIPHIRDILSILIKENLINNKNKYSDNNNNDDNSNNDDNINNNDSDDKNKYKKSNIVINNDILFDLFNISDKERHFIMNFNTIQYKKFDTI